MILQRWLDKMKHDEFGDRMKAYERVYTETRIGIDEILCVRIDGKGFSKFTKNCVKPFDNDFANLMIGTTEDLVRETKASLGYVQSDEITLIFVPGGKQSEYLFGGKVSKINSILASMATGFFQARINKLDKPIGRGIPFFDCRAFAVPDIIEASNVVLWRVQDCRKNSVSAQFRWTLGHSKMKDLSCYQMREVLKSDANVTWEDLPVRYKYGTFVKRTTVEKELTLDEYLRIPEHSRPETGIVLRSEVSSFALEYFGDFSLEDRVDFLGDNK